MNFIAMIKRSALLVDHARGGRNAKLGVGKVKNSLAIRNHLAACPADRVNSSWHAKEQANQVRIMDVQVQHRSADLCRVVEVGQPSWV